MTKTSAGDCFSGPAEVTILGGRVTPELGQFIRQKRLSFGLSLRQLSGLLNISWSTLQKWETGQISRCRPKHSDILSSFVGGKLDAQLFSAKSSPTAFEFSPDQSALLYVQTKENRAVIAIQANDGNACARALQSVFNYINDQIQAMHSAAQQAHTTPLPAHGDQSIPESTVDASSPPSAVPSPKNQR